MREALNARTLELPDVSGLDLAEAALEYARAGWYLLPTDPADIKNPGSVVRGKWHEKSSREPEQIRRWWAENPDYGIALHCGRSGAGVFDLDLDSLSALNAYGRADLAEALLSAGAIQGTRREGDRGHYLFLLPDDGKEYGNSAGAFTVVGEFRGKNGVIIAAPTPHPDAETKGGAYTQRKAGLLAGMPEVLVQCLSEAGESRDPLTDAELTDWLAQHTGAGCVHEGCRHRLDGPVERFRADVEAGGSRHDALTRVLPWAFSEAVAGCYSANEAIGTLRRAFRESFDGDDDTARLAGLGDEFLRLARWAAAQTDPSRAHRNDGLLSTDDVEAFWSARPELVQLRTFARARCAGPWSTLGAVLVRVIATIPPHVVLPPTVGSHASLNLFVAMVAPSGFGKGASEAVADDFVVSETEVWVATPGSGEGILKQYAYKKRVKGEPPVQINQRNTVLFSVPEIDTLAALGGRAGSTLMPELRKAWMGERLGFGWSDVEKAVALMPHRYRMTMIVGVQPGRGGALLQDGDGGTPQRFLWLLTTDPDAPDNPPDAPEPLRLPTWPSPATIVEAAEDRPTLKFGSALDPYQLDIAADKNAFHVLELPPTVVDAIRAEHLAKQRGTVAEAAALDSHAMLARLKVAVGLMWLNGRTDKVSDEDWDLAGIVLGVSNMTRREVQNALRSKASAANKERGRQDAVREVAKAEEIAKVEDAAVARVVERIRKLLRDGNDRPRAAFRRDFGRDKKHFDSAVERLVSVGDVELQPIPGKGTDARMLHLKEGR